MPKSGVIILLKQNQLPKFLAKLRQPLPLICKHQIERLRFAINCGSIVPQLK